MPPSIDEIIERANASLYQRTAARLTEAVPPQPAPWPAARNEDRLNPWPTTHNGRGRSTSPGVKFEHESTPWNAALPTSHLDRLLNRHTSPHAEADVPSSLARSSMATHEAEIERLRTELLQAGRERDKNPVGQGVNSQPTAGWVDKNILRNAWNIAMKGEKPSVMDSRGDQMSNTNPVMPNHQVPLGSSQQRIPASLTFDSIDANHDGVIDRTEFNNAMARSSDVGRAPAARAQSQSVLARAQPQSVLNSTNLRSMVGSTDDLVRGIVNHNLHGVLPPGVFSQAPVQPDLANQKSNLNAGSSKVHSLRQSISQLVKEGQMRPQEPRGPPSISALVKENYESRDKYKGTSIPRTPRGFGLNELSSNWLPRNSHDVK